MKYLRKTAVLLICVIFCAALVISLGKIFAIKNINVTMITYADDETDEAYQNSYDEVKKSLSVFKGDSLLFLKEENIIDCVAGSSYVVTSCEKLFPCTINVVLKERLETFALFYGDFYSMYDSDGIYLRSGLENNNVNDSSPNVELNGVVVEKLPDIAKIASLFKQDFGALRSLVKSISLDTKPDVEGYTDKLNFNLRCGLKIQLDDYLNDTEEKIKTAYEKFCTLTDRQKLSGTLRSYQIGGIQGIINADYSSN